MNIARKPRSNIHQFWVRGDKVENVQRPVRQSEYRLKEDIRFSPEDGFVRLGLHMERLALGALRLGIPLDIQRIEDAILAVVAPQATWFQLRVALDGAVTVNAAPIPRCGSVWLVEWADQTVDETNLPDGFNADLGQESQTIVTPHGIDEIVSCNTSGNAVGGLSTNLFVSDGEMLLTPMIQDGARAGVLRAELLKSGEAQEAALSREDVQTATMVYVGNSLHGLIPAQFV